MTDLKAVTLTTLGDGSAVEIFQEQLNRVLDKLSDPETILA